MIINKITIKNFFRFGNNEQTIDLTGEGISAISAPNGYGKSTAIIDSLIFALYGKYRCNTVDGVVNRYTGKDCKVGVEFEEDGEIYKVIRYRKHSTHNNNVYIFKGDDDISGHTASETNNKILDIIKIPYIGFINSTVFSTELYSAFLANPVSERLVVFENILSLKEINSFYVETKNIIKELNDKMSETKLKYTAINSEAETIINALNKYSSNAKSKLLEMKSKKEYIKKQIEEANKKIKDYLVVDVDKEKTKLSNNTLKSEYENRINSLNLDRKNLIIKDDPNAMLIVEKYRSVNFYMNKMNEEKYKEDSELLKEKENGSKIEIEKINSLSSKQISLEKEIERYKMENMDLANKIEKLSRAICPFCGQHLESERAKEELDNANKKLEYNKSSINDCQEELDNLKVELDAARENYNYFIAMIKDIKANLSNLKFIPNSDLIEEQYNNAVSTIETINKQKKDNEEKLNNIDKEIEELNSKINMLSISPYTEEELNNISNNINSQKELISSLEKEIAIIDGTAISVYDKKYADGLKKQIEDKKIEEENVLKNLKEIEYDLKHYSYLAECFSNRSGGFKKYFIGEMIETFNDRINQYLPFFFSEDVQIKFDKDLNETITMDGFDVDFNSFSQGQRQRAELAISFALFDVARIFFSNNNKLLILDEVDKGLDKFGIRSMINLLKGFDKQLKIFIVSHNPLLDEEIDDKIKIDRDENGFSIIKQ